MTRFSAVALAAVFFVLATLLPAATQGPTMGMAPNNNSLQALYPGQYASVIRMGFAAQGDAPLLSYTWGSANCDRAENGAEVQPATGTGCWHAMFQGLPDARQWGLALTSTPAGNLAALNAAIAYAATYNGCIAVPQPPTPYPVGGSLTLSGTTWIGGCLRGVRAPGYSTSPSEGCQLQFANATGIGINQGGARIEDLSWCGNAATSTSPALTAGLQISTAREVTLRNLYIQNFVVCRQYLGHYSRSHEDNVHCSDQQLYPNLVNQYPLACVESLPGSSGAWAASRLTNDECRYQSFGGQRTVSTGDGVSKNFAIAASPDGTGRLYATDGIKVRVGPDNILPNGWTAWTAPQAVCGKDYTVWDISAGGAGGTGGVQLYCALKTIQVTKGSAVATVTNCAGAACTGDIPALASPYNILLAADHGLDLNPRVTAVTATTLTMTGPATITDTFAVMLTQIGVANDGCGAAVCATNIEVRFVAAPASGAQVTQYWQDPFCAAAYDIENGSDYLTVEPVHVGGCRTVLRYIGQAYGGIRFRPSYIEFQNQLADIEALSYGVTLVFNNRINSPVPGAFAGSYGGMVAPWYVDKTAGAATITYNNRTWLYNGASAGGGWTDYVGGNWYLPGPPGTTYNTTGTALTAQDRAECAPIVFGAAFRLLKMAVNVTAAGAGAGIKFGLYASDPVTGRPGKQLSYGGTAIVSTGGASAAMTDYIGSPGHYWQCYVASWTTAPSVFTFQAPASGATPAGWLIGSTSPAPLYNTNQPAAVSYAQPGLYAAGLPPYLSGLTTDMPSLQAAAMSWQDGQLP